MSIYACVFLMIAAVTCEPSAEVQNQLPRLLVTPNQLASSALLRLQQNPYLQPRAVLYDPNQPENPGVRQDLQYFPNGVAQSPTDSTLRTINENLLITNSRIQQSPSGHPGVLLYNPTQAEQLGTQGRAPVEFPTQPRGVSQKPHGKDSNDMGDENISQGLNARQDGLASVALNPETFLRLQQTQSAQPGVFISYQSPTETRDDADKRKNEAEPSKHNDEESATDNDKLQPAVRGNNRALLTPSQVPLGSLIRFQQNLSQEPGVFLYNPLQQATPRQKDSDTGEEDGKVETTTETEGNPKSDAEGVTGKNLTNQKLTSPNGENGKYYIYHPTGLLQKVTYSTNDDKEKMSFMASLRYQNVEPIREPIYTYDPKTFAFRRV